MEKENFIVVNAECIGGGYFVGLKNHFVETLLEFSDLEECIQIAIHWDKWINDETK